MHGGNVYNFYLLQDVVKILEKTYNFIPNI